MKEPAKVYIIDDHPLIREAIAEIVNSESSLSFVGGTDSTEQALQDLARTPADLLILDLSLGPGLEGLHLIARLREHYPDLRILVNSMYDEKLFAERCMRSGAQGYINKTEPGTTLLAAIQTILSGEVYLSAELQKRIMSTFFQGTASTRIEDLLTDRELEVFQMLGWGFSTTEISRRLGLSKSTVESHRGNLKTKLALDSSSHLIRTAVHWVLCQQTGNPDQTIL